jgi:hypothetical protein
LLKSAISIAALMLVLPYACAPVYRFAPARPFGGAQFYNPYAQSFAWRRANLHAHGRAWFGVTAAAQTDAEVADAYRRRGYDIAAISDYQHIATADPSELRVYEHGFNVGKHHQLAIGARSVAWFDLPLWQGIHQKQYVIDRVAATSDLVAIAHPAALQGYAYSDEELQELSGYQLMEVVNGRFMTESSWDAALSAGRAVWIIGDDDTHDVTKSDRFGVAWNMIGAPTTSPSDVVEALRAGRTYATLQLPDANGPETRLSSVRVEDGTVAIALVGRPADITFVGQHGVIKKTVEDTSLASYAFAADDTYIRAVVRTPTRILFVNPIIRYDGAALPVPVATVNTALTWLERLAIFAVGAVLLISLIRRHRRPGERDSNESRSWRRAVGFMIVLVAALATAARAQETPKPPLPSTTTDATLTSTFDADLLSALPTGDSLFSLVETTHAETISNRVSTGGIGFGTAARLSAFGSSITQTRFRVGDVDITDPSAGGTPLFIPELFLWSRITVSTGMASGSSRTPQTGVDFITPGVAISLEPRRPASKWTTSVDASSSFGDALTATSNASAPPIARLTGWNRGSVLASGPLAAGRAGLVLAGALTHESQTDRGAPTPVTSDVASAFANLVVSPSAANELQTVGWIQLTTFPPANPAVFETPQPTLSDTSVHAQVTWVHGGGPERAAPQSTVAVPHDGQPVARAFQARDGATWRLFAGYSQRTRTLQSRLAGIVMMERLVDGPPMQQAIDTGGRTDRRLSAGARASHRRGVHGLEFGADVDVARSASDPGFSGTLDERVATLPSRYWFFTTPAMTSHRGSTTAAAFASDRITVNDRATLDVALRFEQVTASAEGATQGISWSTVLPRAMFRSTLSARHHVDWFVGGGISAYQLPLDALAWGDPAAPSVDVYRWSPPPPAARLFSVGPGTGRIDPNLRRPYADDLTFGVEARPRAGVTIQLAGLCRWEKRLFGIVNVSPNAPTYSVVSIGDPGLDFASTSDDQVLRVSSLVASAASRFDNVLTNPGERTARRLGAKLTAEYTSDRLFLLFGATAYAAEGVASNRGFHETENDQGTIGDESFDPNSAIFANGRLFGDRAFTGKLSGVYRLPAGVTLGAIARYHDGQPFARLVLARDLGQGPDLVRAYANGGSRFTFTATLDVRLQKEFVVDSHRLVVFVDGYNVTNRADEVEELTVTGTAFRTPTAFQPPRSIHLGARVSF